MHVPKSERAQRWLAAARDDRALSGDIADRFPHLSCYHAQQASDKALKAAITSLHGDAVPTHLGRVLLQALADLDNRAPEEVADAALALDAYYLSTRYPDALNFADAARTFGAAEAGRAIGLADRVLDWATAQLEKVEG